MRAKYPLLRTILKSRTIAKGEAQASVNDLYSGRLPSQVVFALVDNEAFRGHRNKNPYFFHHYDVSSVTLNVNSKAHPSVRFQPRFRKTLEESEIIREFSALMSGIGVNGNEAPLVDLQNFYAGATIWAFDLTPDSCQSWYVKHLYFTTVCIKHFIQM